MRQKASPEGVRCVSGRRAKAIPPVKCPECLVMTPKSRPGCSLGMSLDGDLLSGQAASGIKVARAWLRLLHGTREPYVTKAEERSDPDRSLLHRRWR